MPEITMPRLSDSMEEGTVLRWIKQVGEEVAVGEELVEIETDKANMVYEADVAGTLLEILVDENETAPVGAIRKVLMETPEKFDPRDYMKPARDAMQKVVALRMTQFGQAGHAKDYQAIPLSEVAKRYAGEAVAV